MRPTESRRWFLAIVVSGGLATLIGMLPGVRHRAAAVPDDGNPRRAGPSWPMFGGTPSRNMVNPAALGLPTEWDDMQEPHRNIRWTAALPYKAFGSPVVSGERVYVASNDNRPRDGKTKGSRAV